MSNEEKRCPVCQYHEFISGGSEFLLTCYCPPYKGKLVSDIEKCPKQDKIRGGHVSLIDGHVDLI